MSYLSIRDLVLNGKRVFIRVDFNVPMQKNEKGDVEITSDKRIKASLVISMSPFSFFCIGTLKSTRMKTRFPFKTRSRIER